MLWSIVQGKLTERSAAKDAYIAAKAAEAEADRQAEAAFDALVASARKAILSGEATLNDIGLILMDGAKEA